MVPRRARPADLQRVVEVVLAAMPLDPQWNYRYPYRQEFADDHYNFTSLLFELFIDASYDDWTVMVVEEPSPEDAQTPIIVAFSVWDTSYINKVKYGPDSYKPQSPTRDVRKLGGDKRRDADPVRVNAFGDTGAAAREQYFRKFGDSQMHLQILGTHPDYMRRGHGSALCRWGLGKAAADNVIVSLLASPMGQPLYRELGFRDFGEVVVQVAGEDAKISMHAMAIDKRNVPDKAETVRQHREV